jgi:hypothetical protein
VIFKTEKTTGSLAGGRYSPIFTEEYWEFGGKYPTHEKGDKALPIENS